MRRALFAAPVLLAACAAFPEVEAAERALSPAPPPVLLPTAEVLAAVAAPGRAEAAAAGLAARVAALRARAAALRAVPLG